MNIILCIAFVISFSTQNAHVVGDPTAAFKEANLTFNQKNYELAIEQYQSLESAGYTSPELYYNLGLAHYEEGEIGQAILYLERHLLIQPTSQKGKESLSIIKKEVDVQITEIPPFILWQYYRSAINAFSSSQWAIIQIVSTIILVVLMGLFWFSQRQRRLLMKIGIGVFLLSFMIAWHFADSRKIIEAGGQSAIIMTPVTYLYSGPDSRSEEKARLSEGVKVLILDQIGEWVKVQLSDRDIGWIEGEWIEVI